jgi:hypothetical protein
MSQIINLFDGGRKSRKKGVVNVNSRNVYPTTIVATATTGTNLGLQLIDGYERFNVAQTSAATDFITLPDAPVGTLIEFYAVSACKVQGQGSDTINNVAPSTDITLAAASLSILRKTTTTAWILTQYSAAGVATGPTS